MPQGFSCGKLMGRWYRGILFLMRTFMCNNVNENLRHPADRYIPEENRAIPGYSYPKSKQETAQLGIEPSLCLKPAG